MTGTLNKTCNWLNILKKRGENGLKLPNYLATELNILLKIDIIN
jgi:hypothetical protein